MATFTVGKPISTRVPQITVDGNLGPGRHLFSLVVTDDAGNRSGVARAVVLVSDTPVRPGLTPVFRATEPRFTTVSPARVVTPTRPITPTG